MQCPFYIKKKPKYTIRCSKKVNCHDGGHLGCSTHCNNGGTYNHEWMGDFENTKEKIESENTWKILTGKSKIDYFKEVESE